MLGAETFHLHGDDFGTLTLFCCRANSKLLVADIAHAILIFIILEDSHPDPQNM